MAIVGWIKFPMIAIGVLFLFTVWPHWMTLFIFVWCVKKLSDFSKYQDTRTDRCRKCAHKFYFWTRTNVCKTCYRHFCDVCSTRFILAHQTRVNNYGTDSRTCEDCFKAIVASISRQPSTTKSLTFNLKARLSSLTAKIKKYGKRERDRPLEENPTPSAPPLSLLLMDDVEEAPPSQSSTQHLSTNVQNIEPGKFRSRYYANLTPKSPQFCRQPQDMDRSSDPWTATRDKWAGSMGFAFLQNSITPGQAIVVKILKTETAMFGWGLSNFGLTSLNPMTILSSPTTVAMLPSDARQLERTMPGYWVLNHKDLNNDDDTPPAVGDEICLRFTSAGEILISKNGGMETHFMQVENSHPLWPFFDLYGPISEIFLMGKMDGSKTQEPGHEPILGAKEGVKARSKPQEKNARVSSIVECVICFDRPVDSVIYPCGHMCLCQQCALNLEGNGTATVTCPICRMKVKDIIRTFMP